MLQHLAITAAVAFIASAIAAWQYHRIDAEQGWPWWWDVVAGAVVAALCAAGAAWASLDLAETGPRISALCAVGASVAGGGLHQAVVGRMSAWVGKVKLPGEGGQ